MNCSLYIIANFSEKTSDIAKTLPFFLQISFILKVANKNAKKKFNMDHYDRKEGYYGSRRKKDD
jgi:hypothetical protein